MERGATTRDFGTRDKWRAINYFLIREEQDGVSEFWGERNIFPVIMSTEVSISLKPHLGRLIEI
jgi:hypothetical protein